MDILGITLVSVGGLTLLALLSVERGSLLGPWTHFLSQIFGWAAYLVPFFIGAIGLYILFRRFDNRIPLPAAQQLIGGTILFLTLLTIAAMVAVLISMGIAADTRSQLELSLASLAVVLLIYAAARRRIQAGANEPELARES